MIKAAGKGPLGNFTSVMLGLSRRNTELLLEGRPIMVNLRRDLHPDLPDLTVVLLAGETEADIAEDLRVMGPIVPNPHEQPTDD